MFKLSSIIIYYYYHSFVTEEISIQGFSSKFPGNETTCRFWYILITKCNLFFTWLHSVELLQYFAFGRFPLYENFFFPMQSKLDVLQYFTFLGKMISLKIQRETFRIKLHQFFYYFGSYGGPLPQKTTRKMY